MEFLHNFHFYFHNALLFMLKSNQESLFKIFHPVVENYIELDKNVINRCLVIDCVDILVTIIFETFYFTWKF